MHDSLIQRIQPHCFFDTYTRNSFKEPSRAHWIDGWKIEYVAFGLQETMHLPPVVIIGGAFQNFNSYKYCVEQLLECGPIILVDLPSMGGNQQISNVETGESAGILELPELSAMLGRWMDEVGLNKVSIMGMSLGSVIASHFADQRPEKIERLVLMGVMQKTRPSWRMLLEESLHLMREDRMEEFGQAVILYLINHARLDRTRMSPTAKRLFFRQMAEFATTERLRYEINCNRLLRLQHVPSPQCKTMVACGEFDSFTLPFENANFALQCKDMQFALIENADHVPQLQRRKETMNLFATFLQGNDIAQVEGVRVLNREQMQNMERRGEARLQLKQSSYLIRHRVQPALQANVNVVDINFFGVLIETGSVEMAQKLLAQPRDMQLCLTDVDGQELALECLIFEAQGQRVRALFKHGNFENATRLQDLLKSDAVIGHLI
ncbi:alpha/beta hydrolase [Alkanindiges hydrocarboniclasticus]|uniref:Alpha/beta hydrolase n=1 Tax=Alkanindiges hydrocarboniclasticus TaxID=1907941 RepID=A0A1S8CYF8_9GAMM|nr:alpha/beta hydrolase [Alkanindiges hydrocarboniclasticus]ONG41850.1 alpha/beta hydrolase [Alkanindiges hydrocarboniclasticus]